MNARITQEQRLAKLVDAFKADSGQYETVKTPEDDEGKKRLLRSLMNIREPGEVPAEVLQLQDEYLKARAEEKGVVTTADIPLKGGGLSLWQGDITRLAVDAIVNAANSQMLGCFVPLHACIDNSIHTFAGIQLRNECHRRMQELRQRFGEGYEQPTAVPMLTDGYNLPARKVIHIVGPIVSGKLTAELEKALADCYTNSLTMCMENGLHSIAFCCISTGVFHFPQERAAQIAFASVRQWLSEHNGVIERVIFNVFTDKDRDIYEEVFRQSDR